MGICSSAGEPDSFITDGWVFQMNRRGFLQLFGAGLPAVVIAEKAGLVKKATKYFFAPKQGWAIDGYQYEVYYANAAGLYFSRPDAQARIFNVHAPKFYDGQEIGLYDRRGNLRTDSRIVITSIDAERNIVNFDTFPCDVKVGDLLIA